MIRITDREELRSALRALAQARDAAGFRDLLRRVPLSDLGELLAAEPLETRLALLRLLAPGPRAELVCYFPAPAQDELLVALAREERAELFTHLPADERADLYNRLPEPEREQLLPALARAEREDLIKLAAYPEGSVGSVTTSDFAAVFPEMTVAQALAQLRATAPKKETIDAVYALDREGRLVGAVSLRELVLAPEDALIGEIMRPHPVYARAGWPKSEAAELIRRHDLLALPVINGDERMIGIVTVDDAMDIEKEQDAAQLARFGGSSAAPGGPDLDVLSSSFGRMYRVRVFWLAVLTFFGVLTSTFVAGQEEILSKAIVLAAFIAPIIDMGGNTGSQSATLVIRAMALGQVMPRLGDLWRVIRRELPVAAALGISIALLEAVLAFLSKGVGLEVLAVVGLAMLACTLLGGVVGALLPFAARRLGTDPATLSAPMITSIMDFVGVLIYFGIAWLFLADRLSSGAA